MRELASFPVAFMCDRLGMSPAGYDAGRARRATPTPRMVGDLELTATIREIHGASQGTFGVSRVTAELRLGLGRPVNRKCVVRQMAAAGLQVLTRCKGWRRGKPDTVAFADDLVARSFRSDRPDELWFAGITQHPPGSWVYCAVVMDSYFRLLVGHATQLHLRTELVMNAFDVANWRRRPARHDHPATTYRSTPPGRSDGACARPDCSRRWAASETHSTTPSQNRFRICADRVPRPAPDPSRPDRARQRDAQLDRGVLQPSAPTFNAGLQDLCRQRPNPPDRTRGRGLTTKPCCLPNGGGLQALNKGTNFKQF
jgi:transposase InsO family protein